MSVSTTKGLQIWMPLLGNTCNQGINSKYNTVNAGTPQWATEGKLGNQCLNVQKNADALHYTDTLDETKDMTICAWIKSTATTNTSRYIIWIGSDVNNTGYGMRMSGGTSIEFRMWNNSKTVALTLNTWTHIAMVIDMTALKFIAYVNGVKQGDPISFTKATTNTKGGFNIGFLKPNSYPFLGQIQDVRVYSYQLEDSQCKELSRGKVGHWLCDGNGTSLPNLITGNYSIFKTSTGEIKTGTISSIPAATILANKGKTLCFSMRKYSKGARTNGISSNLGARFGIHWCCKYTRSGTASQYNYPMASLLTDASDGIVYCTWTIPSDLVSVESNLSPVIQTDGSSFARPTDAGVTWYITDVKLEWGTMPSLYSASNQAFLSDISGFGRHGQIIGGVTLSSDTKRYDKSLNFSTSDGRAYASVVQPIPNSPSSMTLSFWIKPNSASANNYRQCFSFKNGSNWLSINTENVKVWFYQGATLYVKSSNGTLDSNWHHIAMVWNGSQYQFYIDGIADTTTCTSAKNYTLNIVAPYISTFIIGNNYTGTGNYGRLFKDYLSDIRLYATALSADDVKELYSLGH